MDKQLVRYLNSRFEVKYLNGNITFEHEGCKFMYSDLKVFNLDNNDSLNVPKVHLLENFISYSVNKAKKLKK